MGLNMSKKVTVIGAGSVGSTIANDLMIQGVASEIVLVDINKKKAIGEALDVYQGAPAPVSTFLATASKIAIFGFTFKENCPDVRNTKVIDIYNSLKEYGIDITVYDPWANVAVAQHEYGIEPVNTLNPEHQFDAVIMAVAHNEFKSIDINAFLKEQSVVYDVKWIINDKVDGKL